MAMLINDEIILLPAIGDSLTFQNRKKQKTLEQRQWQRNQNKCRCNQRLSALPAFQSDQPYQIIFITPITAYFVLLGLIENAQQTRYFAVDTETDDLSKQPALIQIQPIDSRNEMFHKQEQEATIIIFEMRQLPTSTLPIYPRIQQLINTISHPSNTFLIWGHAEEELFQFTTHSLFQCALLSSLHFINVQPRLS